MSDERLRSLQRSVQAAPTSESIKQLLVASCRVGLHCWSAWVYEHGNSIDQLRELLALPEGYALQRVGKWNKNCLSCDVKQIYLIIDFLYKGVRQESWEIVLGS